MPYKQLTFEQQSQILVLHQTKHTQAQIAVIVRVSQPTISRHLNRYNGLAGFNCPDNRLFNPQKKKRIYKKRKLTPMIIRIIEAKLALRWSPQQISAWFRRTIAFNISDWTIYDHIKKDKAAGGKLYLQLRRKGKRYKKRDPVTGSRSFIKHRTSIHDRPDIVAKRIRVGDWELDLIVAKGNRGVLVTIVDRKTRFTLSAKVLNKSAKLVTEAVIKLLEPYKDVVKTITADNGKEFANHLEITLATKAIVYFADPYCSYQKGTNENTNGLLRDYWPKKTAFHAITEHRVDEVIDQLNNRPRAVLGFATPQECMDAHRASLLNGEDETLL